MFPGILIFCFVPAKFLSGLCRTELKSSAFETVDEVVKYLEEGDFVRGSRKLNIEAWIDRKSSEYFSETKGITNALDDSRLEGNYKVVPFR